MNARLLVALEVGASLEALGAVGAEVGPLPRVGVQVFPQMGRLLEPAHNHKMYRYVCVRYVLQKNQRTYYQSIK
jgi:hypothetical protein